MRTKLLRSTRQLLRDAGVQAGHLQASGRPRTDRRELDALASSSELSTEAKADVLAAVAGIDADATEAAVLACRRRGAKP